MCQHRPVPLLLLLLSLGSWWPACAATDAAGAPSDDLDALSLADKAPEAAQDCGPFHQFHSMPT